MDEQKEQFDFTLEDILREFGSGDPAPVEEQPESADGAEVPREEPSSPGEEKTEPEEDLTSDFWQAILHPEEPSAEAAQEPEEAEEDVRIFTGKPGDYEKAPEDLSSTRAFRMPEEAAAPQVTGDTIRLDGSAVASAARAAKESLGDTAVFAPVTDEQAAEAAEPAEPFTKDWEPKYDEPMGEYVPPEPIVFRPRSRLGELKKKLVAGPERRYYALVEQGLGKLQISIFLSCLVVLLSVASVVLYEMHMVQENRMRLLVFGELFAMLLAGVLGTERLLDGLAAIFKGKFTLETMLVITFGACIADCVFCLQEIRVPYCAAFCLEMTMAQWAAYERRNTEMGQMDTMRKATRLNRVVKAPDCYDGKPGFFVEDGEVEDFMEVYNQISGPEKALNLYALIAVVLSSGIGVLAGLSDGPSVGVRIGSAALLAAMPATAFISMTRPMAVLERRMHKLGAVICGWSGAKACSGKAVVPLTDFDLFPGGSVKVNGVKFYSQRDPDDTVAYATALIEYSGMGIASLFTQLLDSRYGRHYEPENFRLYDNGGIGGDVCGEPVLVGSLSFLQEMGVDMPDGARVNQAVYVAVDGELCGVFAMAYGKLKGVSAALGTLTGYRKLQPILTGSNFLLSESFLRTKFNANTKRILFADGEVREELAAWRPKPEQYQICALTTRDELAGMAFAITGARALRGSMRFGAAMHMFFGVLGMAVVLVLSLIEGGVDLLTPAQLLMVELTWAVPGLLTTQWTRKL
ncbi:MAG: hypothetical protein IJ960_03360 [Oscillospiraceae bacterium]|nr:hypothetical protein [Oscillospiraceae bacterium]